MRVSFSLWLCVAVLLLVDLSNARDSEEYDNEPKICISDRMDCENVTLTVATSIFIDTYISLKTIVNDLKVNVSADVHTNLTLFTSNVRIMFDKHNYVEELLKTDETFRSLVNNTHFQTNDGWLAETGILPCSELNVALPPSSSLADIQEPKKCHIDTTPPYNNLWGINRSNYIPYAAYIYMMKAYHNMTDCEPSYHDKVATEIDELFQWVVDEMWQDMKVSFTAMNPNTTIIQFYSVSI